MTVEKKPLNLRDKRVVYATEKNPHHTTGSEINVHPRVAKALLDKGYAVVKKIDKLTKEPEA